MSWGKWLLWGCPQIVWGVRDPWRVLNLQISNYCCVASTKVNLEDTVVVGRWWLFLNRERNHAFKTYEKWSTFLIRKNYPFPSSIAKGWFSLPIQREYELGIHCLQEKKKLVYSEIFKSQWYMGRWNWIKKILGAELGGPLQHQMVLCSGGLTNSMNKFWFAEMETRWNS